MPTKRTRVTNTHRAPSPSPMAQGGQCNGLEDVLSGIINEHIAQISYKKEYEDYLACPCWKHNPLRYRHVHKACTQGVGFKDIGKLMEHIRRVHSLSFGCENCRLRFNKCTIENIDKEKENHMAKCKGPRKELTDAEPEWLSKEQDTAFRQLNFQRDKGTPSQCFDKICHALWGTNSVNVIPGACHQPGFQLSLLRHSICSTLRKQALEEMMRGPQDRALPAGPPETQSIDPRLLQQGLRDLSSGPKPFYREQPHEDHEDSGIFSYDPENEFAYQENDPDRDISALPREDLDYVTTGMCIGPLEFDGNSDIEFEDCV
ncbi:hypothetical protein F4779DRAFT_581561 [Xylariaceae sp. FL0662B]|nr:hypothetical protein F4779DRAFT_581561 [Xylariaceae sp. FL0662B]